MKAASSQFLLLLLLLASQLAHSAQTPLFTAGRWVVDATGRRVKLACANWAAHLEPAVAEGLSRQPLGAISVAVARMGFNCVRLTWPLYLLTNATLGLLSLHDSLLGLGLNESAAGVRVNNPDLLHLPLVQVLQAVISSLESRDIMVILDNQISKPGWCCTKYDGNGFFGDKYFDPDEWLHGLATMASMTRRFPNVVGMSLRNELRGPNQNVSLWYRYMQKGAEIVHAANSDLLVIISGLDYDKDLSLLHLQQMDVSFERKLVYEVHWYGFSDGGDWESKNQNDVCSTVLDFMDWKAFFLLKKGWPLFVSEFGADMSGTQIADNRYLSCFMSAAAEHDFDWAFWALQGSYYVREGGLAYDETYGLLSWDWCKVRNSNFIKRIGGVQLPYQGPGLSKNPVQRNILFHPLSGLCVVMKHPSKWLELGSCSEAAVWNYTSEHRLVQMGTGHCLQADELGSHAKMGASCDSLRSNWYQISNSKMHLSSRLANNGSLVCLDVDSDGRVFTNSCNCLSSNATCTPDGQWFKIIASNREMPSRSASGWPWYGWTSILAKRN